MKTLFSKIPDILKIRLIKGNNSEGYWQVNLIPYYDYINLGRYIIKNVTGIENIPDSLVFNLLYWTEYLYIKGAIAELPVSPAKFFSYHDAALHPRELDVVGMQAKLSTIIWDCPADGLYIPSRYSVGHITRVGYVLDVASNSPARDIVVQEILYNPSITEEYQTLDSFVTSKKFRLYQEIIEFLYPIFSALVLNYSKCRSESELYSEITRNVAWNPSYKEQPTSFEARQITYLYNDEPKPLYCFDWMLLNTKPKERDYKGNYPYDDFAHAQALYVSKAQYASVFDLDPVLIYPDKKLWSALARRESKEQLIPAFTPRHYSPPVVIKTASYDFDPFEDVNDKRVKTADLQAAKDEFDPFETLETPQTLDIDPFEASGTLKDLTKKKQETTSKIDEEAEEIFVFENDIFDGLETSDSGTEDTDKEGKRPSTGIIKDIDTVDVFIEDPFAEDLPATAANKKN